MAERILHVYHMYPFVANAIANTPSSSVRLKNIQSPERIRSTYAIKRLSFRPRRSSLTPLWDPRSDGSTSLIYRAARFDMEPENENDELLSVLPIHFSNALIPNLHIHQFPLHTRPLEVPPSAAASGKRIKARIKPGTRRFEVHVPVDTRPEVWNAERSRELGSARVEDDKEKNQELPKMKQREGDEPRLTEMRLRSERVPQSGAYVLGVVRHGQ